MAKKDSKIVKQYLVLGLILAGLFALELILSLSIFPLFSGEASAGYLTNQTARVTTLLEVGNVFPEILNVSINSDANSLDLVPNATVSVNVSILARDYNNETDIINVTVRFYDTASSNYNDADNYNKHYTNDTCMINYSYGDEYEISSICTLDILYNALNSTWIANVTVTDRASLNDTANDTIVINSLIALQVPDALDYGVVNATYVSREVSHNVTNYGNTAFNLTLEGYASVRGDGFAMNCTLGATKNISLIYERYNLNNSNSSFLNLTQFNDVYTNLTNSSVITGFYLGYNINQTANNATNPTYWRIYVPRGVAGNCSGNIIFGATL